MQHLSLSERLLRIRETLSAEKRSGQNDKVEAVVAILLLEDDLTGLNTLLIHRIDRAGDPWSGQIGLPGGRVERTDVSARDAIMREVLEEVGIDLRRDGEELGPLTIGHPARSIEMRVQPWVFGLEKPPKVIIGSEVQEAFWVALTTLPSTLTTAAIEIRGMRRQVDAFRIDGRTVWGFTYRVLTELLQVSHVTLSSS